MVLEMTEMFLPIIQRNASLEVSLVAHILEEIIMLGKLKVALTQGKLRHQKKVAGELKLEMTLQQ